MTSTDIALYGASPFDMQNPRYPHYGDHSTDAEVNAEQLRVRDLSQPIIKMDTQFRVAQDTKTGRRSDQQPMPPLVYVDPRDHPQPDLLAQLFQIHRQNPQVEGDVKTRWLLMRSHQRAWAVTPRRKDEK